MKENDFQSKLKKNLEAEFPDAIIAKLDSSYVQGIPDLIILYNDKWAALECKRSKNAARQNNQEYYVDKLNRMSYSAFVDPNNMEEVINDIRQTFRIKK